jgi:hypothetical protein
MNEPSTNSHFGGAMPFKVHVNFGISLFDLQIYVDALEKWLSLIEGYFFVQIFSSSEKITFVLLKGLHYQVVARGIPHAIEERNDG